MTSDFLDSTTPAILARDQSPGHRMRSHCGCGSQVFSVNRHRQTCAELFHSVAQVALCIVVEWRQDGKVRLSPEGDQWDGFLKLKKALTSSGRTSQSLSAGLELSSILNAQISLESKTYNCRLAKWDPAHIRVPAHSISNWKTKPGRSIGGSPKPYVACSKPDDLSESRYRSGRNSSASFPNAALSRTLVSCFLPQTQNRPTSVAAPDIQVYRRSLWNKYTIVIDVMVGGPRQRQS